MEPVDESSKVHVVSLSCLSVSDAQNVSTVYNLGEDSAEKFMSYYEK